MPELVFALAANPHQNSRAVRQIRTLAESGISVQVLSIAGNSSKSEFPENVSESSIVIKNTGGPAFFREIKNTFLNAALQTDVQHYHASDLYVLGAMAGAALRKGMSYSYDARECYPYVATTVGRPWIRLYWKLLERRFIHGASARFTVSESIAAHMSDAYRIPPPTLVLNVPPIRSVNTSSLLRDRLGLSLETSLVLHLGQLRKDRGCDVLVKAMSWVPDAHLVFLGSGPEQNRLTEIAFTNGTTNRVHFVSPVTPDQVLNVASAASIGVTLLQDTCLNHRYALPNKLFEYVAAGLPVLAADLKEMNRVVSAHDLGRVVDGSDDESVGRTLNEMLTDKRQLDRWKVNAARARETFNWEKASQPFIAELRPLVTS